MDYSVIVTILGIMFWALLAGVVVCLLVYCYIQLCYLRMAREDREKETVIEFVQQVINEKLEELKNDPAIEHEQNADAFETEEEYTN